MNRPDKQEVNEINELLSCRNCIEIMEEETPDNFARVYYIQYNQERNELEAGSVCNAGLCVEYAIEYDASNSIYDNFQALYDAIIDSIWGCV